MAKQLKQQRTRVIDEAEVDQMRTFARAIIPAVEDEDIERIRGVYRTLHDTFHVDGPHAVAMILAEQIRKERSEWRARLVDAQNRELRYQEAYLVERRRVGELRGLIDRTASTKPRTKRKDTA